MFFKRFVGWTVGEEYVHIIKIFYEAIVLPRRIKGVITCADTILLAIRDSQNRDRPLSGCCLSVLHGPGYTFRYVKELICQWLIPLYYVKVVSNMKSISLFALILFIVSHYVSVNIEQQGELRIKNILIPWIVQYFQTIYFT